MLKRIVSSFTAIILAFGLSVPVQALALAPGELGGEANASSAIKAADSEIDAKKQELIEKLENAAEQWRTDYTDANRPSSMRIAGWAETGLADTSQADAAFREFRYEHGQYFYTLKLDYPLNSDRTGNDVCLLFDTSYQQDDLDKFDAAVNAALAGVDSAWSIEEKALYLHDYIVTHCEYDFDDDGKYTAYDALVGGDAYCQGYTEAFDYLLERADASAKCWVVRSAALNHVWNLVEIDGQTYHIDCTWDDPYDTDPVTGEQTAIFRTPAYCDHENFLVATPRFYLDNHESTDWELSSGEPIYSSATIARSETYENAYWRDVTTSIPHLGRICAYVTEHPDNYTETVDVLAHDYATSPDPTGADDTALITGVPARWEAVGLGGDGHFYWTGHYTNLVALSGTLYVSTPTDIREYSADGEPQDVYYELSSSEMATGRIYGIAHNAATNEIDYYLLANPDGRKFDLATATASLSQSSLAYTGQRNVPTVDVAYAGLALREGSDFTVQYLNAAGTPVSPVDVGAYTVALTGKGLFVGTRIAGTFSITKAKNELWTNESKVSKKFKAAQLKKAKKFALPELLADFGENTAKWQIVKGNKKSKAVLKLKGTKIQVKKKAAKGTYTIQLQASVHGTANYAAAQLAKRVTVKVKVK